MRRRTSRAARTPIWPSSAASTSLAPDVRQEIEEAFAAAAKDRSLVRRLGALLQKHNVFQVYEDRFFALMKN